MNTPVILTAPATPTAPALILRPWSTEDVAAVVEAFEDPGVRRGSSAPIDNEADGLRWLRMQERGWAAGDRFGFAVVDVPGDDALPRVVGNVGLREVASGKPSAEVGYWTVPWARGQGVAPRALEALTTWALDTFRADGLERLELLHQLDNPASCRVAEKCGYGFDSLMPSAPPLYPLDGHVHVLRVAAG